MKITWVTRSFLDYRVPVFHELDNFCGGQLTLVYSNEADILPKRCDRKVKEILKDRAIALVGEKKIRFQKRLTDFANKEILLPCQSGLISAVMKSQPDIIVSDGFFQWTYSALWLRAFNNIPHVMCYERTAHTERNAQWYRKAYRKFVMRWIDAICCNGSLTGQYVESMGFPKNKLTYGHMVADTEGLYEKVCSIENSQIENLRLSLKANDIVFLYVGQIISRKGIAELLQSWLKFSTNINIEATLVLVGDGPERQELERFTQQNRLHNVVFTGKIDYDKIASYYKLADVFVIPTLEDNWSLVVPEAMACGLPIMCSKYNGCHPELVTKDNGWVFDPLNQENTVNTLSAVLSSKSRFAQMGQQSREIIENGHTPKHAAKAIYEACKIVLERSVK